MPLMKPPSYTGLRYNLRKIAEGELVDVLDRDVAALEAAGWEHDSNPPPPVLDVTPTDEPDEED